MSVKYTLGFKERGRSGLKKISWTVFMLITYDHLGLYIKLNKIYY